MAVIQMKAKMTLYNLTFMIKTDMFNYKMVCFRFFNTEIGSGERYAYAFVKGLYRRISSCHSVYSKMNSTCIFDNILVIAIIACNNNDTNTNINLPKGPKR